MMNTKPAIWTTYYEKLSPEDAIRALVKGGFHYGDFDVNQAYTLLEKGDSLEKTAQDFKAFLDDVDFHVPQGHLNMLADVTIPKNIDVHKKDLDFFQTIGVKQCVLHLSGARGEDMAVRREKNMKALQQLQEYLRGTDMSICIENMCSAHYLRTADEIMKIIEELGYNNLSVCLDTGHYNTGNVKGYYADTQRDFILRAGPYLKALHLNGNNGKSDQHVAPFCNHDAPDFMEIVKALHEINYCHLFSLENGADGAPDIPFEIQERRLVYLKDLLDLMIDPDFIKN